MRGKGLILFFSIALILICIYQLSFNFVTHSVEKKASQFAETAVLKNGSLESLTGDAKDSVELEIRKKRQAYLDSISNETVYNLAIVKYSYQDCKDQQLNLGL